LDALFKGLCLDKTAYLAYILLLILTVPGIEILARGHMRSGRDTGKEMTKNTNRVLPLLFTPQFCLPLMLTACRAMLIVVLFCCSLSLSAQTNRPITIGTITGQIQTPNSFLPFTEYLDSWLSDYEFEVVGFSSIEALIQAVEDESLDLAFITPAAFVEINQESELRVLATITQPAANTYSPWLAGAVFTRADNTDIQSMSDIKGSKVVALSELALGGWLSAARDWQELGINIETDLESVDFQFSYDRVIDSVCSGEADAGVIAASIFQNFAARCEQTLKTLPPGIQNQNIDYPLAHSTRLYPEVAFAITRPLDEVFIRNLTRAILDIEPRSEIARAVNISGFTAPLSYNEVELLMRELRLGPFASLGEQTLRQYLNNNIYTVTLALIAVIVLISAGFLNTLSLIHKFRSSENYRKSIFEGSHIPMVIVDQNQQAFLDMNIAAVKQYGYQTKEELIGKPLIELSAKEQDITGSIVDAFEENTNKVLTTGRATFEWWHIRPNGEKWLGKIHLMAFESGDGLLLQSTIEDITAQKKREEERAQLEQQLEFSQRMASIGRLAGGIAHDFNNLLTVINGYSEILLEDHSKNEADTRILEQIKKAGNRAAELTQKLLTFSRRQAVRHVPVTLGLIVEDSAEMIRSVLGENIALKLELNDTDKKVFADPAQLQQVLLNLVVNAKDAMPDGGKLIITCQEAMVSDDAAIALEIDAGAYIEMVVSDDGIGMDSNISNHIFDPFFTTKDSGTGLGLSTVYGIIQQSMGAIQVNSEKGRGSTFTVYFPETNIEEKNQETEQYFLTLEEKLYSIMVVENEKEIKEYTSSVLEKAGHQVITAESGAEALDLLARLDAPVELLITDVMMKGMNGGELAELINKQYPEIPVLYISGYPEDALALHGIQRGTESFLAKPFSPVQLLKRINKIMGNPLIT